MGQQEYSPRAHFSTAVCLGRDVWPPGTSCCSNAKRSVGAQLTVSNLIHGLCMDASGQRSILALVAGTQAGTRGGYDPSRPGPYHPHALLGSTPKGSTTSQNSSPNRGTSVETHKIFHLQITRPNLPARAGTLHSSTFL